MLSYNLKWNIIMWKTANKIVLTVTLEEEKFSNFTASPISWHLKQDNLNGQSSTQGILCSFTSQLKELEYFC